MDFVMLLFLFWGGRGGIDWGKSEKFVKMPRNLEISDFFFFSLLYRIHRSRCGEGHVTANLRFEGGKAAGRLSTTKDGRVGMKLAQIEALTIINYPTRTRQAFNTLLLLLFDAPTIWALFCVALVSVRFMTRCRLIGFGSMTPVVGLWDFTHSDGVV